MTMRAGEGIACPLPALVMSVLHWMGCAPVSPNRVPIAILVASLALDVPTAMQHYLDIFRRVACKRSQLTMPTSKHDLDGLAHVRFL